MSLTDLQAELISITLIVIATWYSCTVIDRYDDKILEFLDCIHKRIKLLRRKYKS